MNHPQNTDHRILSLEDEALIRSIESPLYSSPWAWGAMLLFGYSFIRPGQEVVTPLFVFWIYVLVLLADRAVTKKRATAIVQWIELRKNQENPKG
jgi:hypothetical protein